MTTGKIVIVGGGIGGAALAWWLARRGAREVVLLEREEGLGRHSSGLNAAILRTASDAPATRTLALETAAFLREPPRGFCEHPLLDACGLLVNEGAAADPQPPWAEPFEALGAVERVTRKEADRLAPHFRAIAERAWYFPGDGRLDIAALLDGFAAGARRGGVELRTGAEVRRLLHAGGEVRGVELTGGERVEADRTVLAAGAWAGALGAEVGGCARLRPTRRHLLVTGVDPRVDPRWPIVWDELSGIYCRPESGGLLVCACDVGDVRPDECVTDPAVREQIALKAARHLPAFADAPAAHFWAGLRTLTEDDAPVIGDDPHVPGLFWLAGLGGHGMSISAAAGRVAAELLLGERVDAELESALRPERADGRVSARR